MGLLTCWAATSFFDADRGDGGYEGYPGLDKNEKFIFHLLGKGEGRLPAGTLRLLLVNGVINHA